MQRKSQARLGCTYIAFAYVQDGFYKMAVPGDVGGVEAARRQLGFPTHKRVWQLFSISLCPRPPASTGEIMQSRF